MSGDPGAGDILYAKHEGLCTLKLVGDIRYTVGPAAVISRSLDAFLDRLFAAGDFEHVVVDMTETTAIDSTNLGLLARLASCMRARGQGCATILSTRPDITRTLESVGFDRVFDIVREAPQEDLPLASLPRRAGTDREALELILRSHRRLMSLSERNREMFSGAVELLDRELRGAPADGPERGGGGG